MAITVKLLNDKHLALAVEAVKAGSTGVDLIKMGVKNEKGKPLSGRSARRLRNQIIEEYKIVFDNVVNEDTERDQVKFEDFGNRAEANAVTHSRIMTLDDLVEACDIDLDVWQVDRYVVNKWEVGRKDKQVSLSWDEGVADGEVVDTGKIFVEPLIQVKAWLSKRQDKLWEEIVDELIEEAKEYMPDWSLPAPAVVGGNHLFVANFYDQHFGKRIVGKTVTLKEVAVSFKKAVDDMIARVLADPRKIDTILIPMGHDILHVDGLNETTTRGTKVEMQDDPRMAGDVAFECYRYLVEKSCALAKQVVVAVVQGNHSRYTSHFLGKMLEAWFHTNEQVIFITTPSPRQYVRYGVNAICMTHGEKMSALRVAAVMPKEMGDAYDSGIEYMEVLTGHYHKKQETYVMVTEEAGVVVRTIPAMCDIDQYHLLHAFVGTKRAAEGMYYHETKGPAGNFLIYVD